MIKANPILIEKVAQVEGLDIEFIRQGVQAGTIVIPANKLRNIEKPVGIGKGLRTKVNANLGTSGDCTNIDDELAKLKIAVKYGADCVMDLSTGGDLDFIRKEIIEKSPVPIGTVPIYQAAWEARSKGKELSDITAQDMLKVLEDQARDGVDFFTIHCGVTRSVLECLESSKRVMGIVSRGGAILMNWMKARGEENPFYAQFDQVLDLAKEYDITLSLGDGLRPGCLDDATDRPQLQELIILGELARRSREHGVQVMIEGPGHVPLNQVEANIKLAKSLTDETPFYVLGPLVTDIAPGYDHITAAIGGAIAAAAGADFLCYVTSAEHLRLPSVEDVKEGVIASVIAAHAGDIAKGVKGARDKDRMISVARKKRDWEQQFKLAIDPEKARKYRESSPLKDDTVCSMCGEYCSIKLTEQK